MRYDLVMGFSSNRSKLFVAFACVVVLAAMYLSSLDAAARHSGSLGADGSSGGFGFADVLAYFFAGSDYYSLDDKVPFVLPIGWLIQQVLVAVLVGHYVVCDLGAQASQVLVRVGRRQAWWLAKCMWVVATVGTFYAVEAVVALFTTVVFGALGTMGDTESIMVLGFPLSVLDGGQLVLLLSLSVALSLALSLAQVALSLVAGPFAAFVSIVSFVVISVYFDLPFFMGDCSMMVRSGFVRQGGVDSVAALAACAAVMAASVIMGGLAFDRKDMIERAS